MVLDKKYADAYRKYYEGKITYDRLTNIMSSYGLVIYQDLGSENEYYNVLQRSFQPPEEREEELPFIKNNPIIENITGAIY